ncbi:enolase C-terminal domain-like protein [Chelativorans sp. YIM 93263]|uniref:enolase C-terminal domain-like protein n=1 Tax=Chelativorans sp. YIM 93263 TaxID=2906648 RepID=UPI0023798339|nr:enolase C-terminal domain-like protein [Chelativorans sp. YIM 93263]
MRIERVEALRIKEPEWDTPAWWCTTPLDGLFETGRRLRNSPMGLFSKPVGHDADPVFAVIVRITTDAGLTGIGTIGLGSQAAASIIEQRLAPLILGMSPFDVELIWELMYRSTINIGRKGLLLEAISGIDIALWDIMGKATGRPVYDLLGGRTRERIRGYASAAYAMEDLDQVVEMARGYKKNGFTAMKMRFGWGPSDGRPGMQRNLEMVRRIREAIGDDMELMSDAYMGWSTQYAIEMLPLLEPYQLAWVEEPLTPDDYDGYTRIRQSSRTAIAAGEHEFTRYGFKELITRGCVDIVQLDVNRCGGITEARKIVALAQSFNLPVVPHAPDIHNVHLIMAQHNIPLVEVFPDHGRDGDTFIRELLTGNPPVADGHMTLSEAPGLGVDINHEIVDPLLV